jgi:hypothetical protein
MIQKQKPCKKNALNSSTKTAWKAKNSTTFPLHQPKIKHYLNPCISDFTTQGTIFTNQKALVRSHCSQSFILFELSTIWNWDLKWTNQTTLAVEKEKRKKLTKNRNKHENFVSCLTPFS